MVIPDKETSIVDAECELSRHREMCGLSLTLYDGTDQLRRILKGAQV